MEHVRHIERRKGVDVGYGKNTNIHPVDREGCVGAAGINKSFTFEMVLEIAYKMQDKPNIIIKAGENAKWYLKRFDKNVIEDEINKQHQWRDITRSTMYIIDWDE